MVLSPVIAVGPDLACCRVGYRQLQREQAMGNTLGNSLRDAMLKAGVVEPSKVKVAIQQGKKQERQDRHRQRTGAPPQVSEATEAAARAEAERLARDRELNRQRQEAAAAKAGRIQAKQLLREQAKNDDKAEELFNFTEGKLIRHLYVTSGQRKDLLMGRLVIVALGERHFIVTAEIGTKVQGLVPGIFIYQVSGEEEKRPSEDDDPYGAYQVPDDLLW